MGRLSPADFHAVYGLGLAGHRGFSDMPTLALFDVAFPTRSIDAGGPTIRQ